MTIQNMDDYVCEDKGFDKVLEETKDLLSFINTHRNDSEWSEAVIKILEGILEILLDTKTRIEYERFGSE